MSQGNLGTTESEIYVTVSTECLDVYGNTYTERACLESGLGL